MPGAARDLAPNAQPSHRTGGVLHLAHEQDAAERQLRRRAQYASLATTLKAGRNLASGSGTEHRSLRQPP
jgi:hypothetical protein